MHGEPEFTNGMLHVFKNVLRVKSLPENAPTVKSSSQNPEVLCQWNMASATGYLTLRRKKNNAHNGQRHKN